MSLTFNKQINKDLFLGFRGSFTYAENKIIEQDEAPGIIGTNRSSTGLPGRTIVRSGCRTFVY